MLVICIQNHVLCLLWLNEGPLLHEVSKNAYFHLGLFSIITVRTVIDIGIFISRGSTLFQYNVFIYTPGKQSL